MTTKNVSKNEREHKLIYIHLHEVRTIMSAVKAMQYSKSTNLASIGEKLYLFLKFYVISIYSYNIEYYIFDSILVNIFGIYM